jgi:hypothetical protein
MKFIRFSVQTIVFLLFYVAILLMIVLLSTGILALPIAISVMSGFFTSVASDLAPQAILFAGISCLSAGLALALSIVMLFPKQPFIFKRFDKWQ